MGGAKVRWGQWGHSSLCSLVGIVTADCPFSTDFQKIKRRETGHVIRSEHPGPMEREGPHLKIEHFAEVCADRRCEHLVIGASWLRDSCASASKSGGRV